MSSATEGGRVGAGVGGARKRGNNERTRGEILKWDVVIEGKSGRKLIMKKNK